MKAFLLFLALTQIAFAKNATVTMVRGNVTKLLPHTKEATKVKKGDILPEDTSIVTSEKSIVRLKFQDKSTVSLGPKSMLVVKVTPKKSTSNVLGVLKGVIRANVQKSDRKAKNKLLIKTRSAVLGVRGTTFKTVYNPANNNTSLVTIEGEVAMAKVEPKKAIEEAPAGQEATVDEAKAAENEVEKLTEVLESQEAVTVAKGEFSGVVEKVEKPTQPVKVAPKQMVAIVKHDELAEKKVKLSDEEIIKEIYEEAPKKDKKLVDGYVDKANGELAPRAGGYVDFKSGLYVPPTKDSKLDEKRNVYVAKENIGKVDESGEYIPPKGVIIDEKKGFVVDTKEIAKVASSAEIQRLQNQVGFLNDQVGSQVRENASVDEDIQTVSTKKKILGFIPRAKNAMLSASVTPFSRAYSFNNRTNDAESEFLTKSATQIDLVWKLLWSEKWSTDFAIGIQNLTFDIDGVSVNENDSTNGLISLHANFNYQLNRKTQLYSNFSIQDTLYLIPFQNNGSSSLNVGRTDRGVIELGGLRRIYDVKKITAFIGGALRLYSDAEIKDNNSGDLEGGLGFNLLGKVHYDYSNRLKIEGLGYLSRAKFDQDIYEISVLDLGFGLNFIYDI